MKKKTDIYECLKYDIDDFFYDVLNDLGLAIDNF